MGKTTPIILLYMVLVFLTASVSAGCKPKKACKMLKGSCISKDQECDGQEVQHKTFCKGSKCKCCFPTYQKPCPTGPPPPPPTSTIGPPPAEVKNIKPIIGILAQELSGSLKRVFPEYNSYIAASYVKFLESGGARVVPIMIDQTDDYYEHLVKSLNGIVFPGGSVSITSSSGYGRAGRKLYDLILESGRNGNPVPLWATCLGFEMLMYLEAKGRTNGPTIVLSKCKARDISIPLELKDWESSSLLGSAPGSIMLPLATMNITSNFHKYCVLPQTFEKYSLNNSYAIISTNHDEDGLEFISTVEHKTLPIWGTQWHPEKNAFEWKYSSIPHFPEAIDVGNYFSKLFGDKARQNSNSFSSKSEERSYLIYNHQPIYLTPFKDSHDYYSSFQQAYFFN